jgi:hypothetical protein
VGAVVAGLAQAPVAAGVLAAAAIALALRIAWESGRACRTLSDAVARELAPDR